MKAAAQIFLSYAREDEERVETLYQELSDAGFKPWMDKKDILPGEQWKSRIPQAIRRSDFFLVCLSANSVDKRGWIQKEIKEALDTWQEMLDSDIYLIPVRLEDCRVPERLSDFQWVNLFEKDGWTRLVEAIRVGIERRAKVTKPVAQKFTPFESHPVYKLSSLEVERKAPKKAEAIPKEEQIYRQREREPQKLQAPSETPSTPEAKTSPPDLLKAASQRQLSPWNPLDHLRLLWWVLVTPQRLRAYREAFGKGDEHAVGRWLVGALIWLPLFIHTLAMGLQTLLRTRDANLFVLFSLFSLAVLWVLTVLLGESDNAMAVVVLLGAFGVMFAAAFLAALLFTEEAGVNVVRINVVGSMALGVAIGVATGVAVGMEVNVVLNILASLGVGMIYAFFFFTFASDIVWVIGVGASVALVVGNGVKGSLKTGRPSSLAWGAFGALVLAHAFLIWFSFLGGWQVFQ